MLTLLVIFGAGTAVSISLADYSDIRNAELNNGSISISGESITGEVTYQIGEDVDTFEVGSMYIENRLLEAELLNQTEMRGEGLAEKVVRSERIDSRSQNLSLNSSVDAVRFTLERNTEDGLSPALVEIKDFSTGAEDAGLEEREDKDESVSLLESIFGFLSSLISF